MTVMARPPSSADQGDYKVEPVVSLSEGGHAAPGKSRPPDAVAVIIAIIVIIVIIVIIIVIVIVIIAIIIIIAFYPAISCGLSLMAAFISSFTPLVLPI